MSISETLNELRARLIKSCTTVEYDDGFSEKMINEHYINIITDEMLEEVCGGQFIRPPRKN